MYGCLFALFISKKPISRRLFSGFSNVYFMKNELLGENIFYEGKKKSSKLGENAFHFRSFHRK